VVGRVWYRFKYVLATCLICLRILNCVFGMDDEGLIDITMSFLPEACLLLLVLQDSRSC